MLRDIYSQIFANFLGQVIVNLNMPRDGRNLHFFSIDIEAMVGAFPQQYAPTFLKMA
jgi:hypothetical protein